MSRRARTVFPGLPHHVTQRGNHRQRVFFDGGDQAAYLGLLRDHATKYGVEVVAYCLMPNHVHHVVVPTSAVGLHKLFKAVHGQYAQRINRMRGESGHLWQGRFFSSALDAAYFLNAVRYVELNPVRAKIVARAETYPWSSAAAHCGNRADLVVDTVPRSTVLRQIGDWSRWLAEGLRDEAIHDLRRNGSQNLPCGNEAFIAQLEQLTGRPLQYKTHGGPRALRSDRQAR